MANEASDSYMKHVDVDLTISYGYNHANGDFEWDVPPSCCSLLKTCFEDKGIFVSNFVEEGFNHCYLQPVTAEGDWLYSKGVPIRFCPFCGTKIQVLKKYGSDPTTDSTKVPADQTDQQVIETALSEIANAEPSPHLTQQW